MPNGLLLMGALLCGVIGFAWLALTMEPHWRQVRGPHPLPKPGVPRLRVLGSGALTASLLLCLMADHPSMAVLVWIMALAAAALLVAFTFAWKPRLLLPLVVWIK